MKKILTIALVIAMMLSLAVVASAETLDSREDDYTGVSSGNIQIDYVDNSTATSEKVYYVVVTWEDTAMSYTKSGDTSVWNPLTHEYEDKSTTTWTDSTATVKVFNHSNDAITATLALINDTANNGVTLTSDVDSIDIVSAEDKAVDAPELEGVFTITATGDPTADVTVAATVTIAADVTP